ncbi:unnamed protein product [Ostreobium quekettii]|uniref:GST N-terminal domain-containing protein n=1 Tax=Ostreobium quekettii TaxID=121088 RepID=A0A8S1J036_9CHLO|nr:unnamed protein product [Ostreobium quekettii]|eukprot:evm.model.scf_909.3 EVM.evm.TU.scf_909.3   scf_909:32231-37398(+)
MKPVAAHSRAARAPLATLAGRLVGPEALPRGPGQAMIAGRDWDRPRLGRTVRGVATRRATATEGSTTKEGEYNGPEPKRFAIAEGNRVAVLTAAVTTIMRFGSGALTKGYKASIDKTPEGFSGYAFVSGNGRQVNESSKVAEFPRPNQPLEIYEFEGCPFCRKAREAVSILDLDVLFYPCPKGGTTYRPKAVELGGKAQFPYLVDPNTGVSMYESDDIIKYLFDTYGDGEVPFLLSPSFLTAVSCGLAMLPRAGKGTTFAGGKAAVKPIVYWGYEGSPFCKIVRETLVELEIPHLQKSCARGSPKRQELYKYMGLFQVPFIEDPNTGVSMFESAEIIKYLRETYGAQA